MDFDEEIFKAVNKEVIEYSNVTTGLVNLLKDDIDNKERRAKDYDRKIDDSPNLSRPPISENILEIIFSNDLPLVDETLRFFDSCMKEVLDERSAPTTEEDKVYLLTIEYACCLTTFLSPSAHWSFIGGGG